VEQIIESIKISITTKNYLSALGISLTLPDICGWLRGEQSTPRRFQSFFESYLSDLYTSNVGASNRKTTFMTGDDLYALRCAYLHQGSDDITGQRARDTLDRFKLVAGETGQLLHRNLLNDRTVPDGRTLLIDVPTFCMELVAGTVKFLDEHGTNPDVEERRKRLGNIAVLAPGRRTLL